MKEQVLYVFLGRKSEDAAIALDPIKYEGIDDWELIGEVRTLTELKELLENEPFDPSYWNQLLDDMSPEFLRMLTK